MSRIFETVEDYVHYIENLNKEFAKSGLHEHVMAEMITQAYHFVYNPRNFKPKVYDWTYTMANPDYYKTVITNSASATNSSSLDAYTFSTSPHVHSVVNGSPYDFYFRYYDVERPFIEVAENQLMRRGQEKVLKHDLVNYYKSYGLDAK